MCLVPYRALALEEARTRARAAACFVDEATTSSHNLRAQPLVQPAAPAVQARRVGGRARVRSSHRIVGRDSQNKNAARPEEDLDRPERGRRRRRHRVLLHLAHGVPEDAAPELSHRQGRAAAALHGHRVGLEVHDPAEGLLLALHRFDASTHLQRAESRRALRREPILSEPVGR